MQVPIDWLLEGEPFVRYRARLDLLGEPAGSDAAVEARREMVTDRQVRDLVRGLADWPGTVIASHKSAGQPFHRLTFAADLGLRPGDPGVSAIVDAVRAHQSAEGPYQLPTNVATRYGGTGVDTWAWALCDAPLLVYALATMGLGDDPGVRKAVACLAGLLRQNGWPCAVSKELGSFRGPGAKGDPCPFATLAMLKALSAFDDLRDSDECRTGAETLLRLWSESRARHPYLFYMGTDFRKLKAPFVWYDLLHVLDVLSRFPWLASDRRFCEMVDAVAEKAGAGGRFTAESVWVPWKSWEFGQKKQPSRWVTLLAWRILGRVGRTPEGRTVPA
jgi:hypothetical protein